MSTNDRDLAGVTRRLRKILALAESANPGEAAAALQQARTIMDKYGIDAVDAAATEVGESAAKLSGADLPLWESALVGVIKASIGVQVLIKGYDKVKGAVRPRGTVVFIGEGPKPQIAAYAFDVLRKKLRASIEASAQAMLATAYPGGVPDDITFRLTTKQRQSYALGWCASVQAKVQALASPPSPAVKRYMEKFGQLDKPAPIAKASRRARGDSDPLAAYLISKGLRDGREVALHQAVNNPQGQKALTH